MAYVILEKKDKLYPLGYEKIKRVVDKLGIDYLFYDEDTKFIGKYYNFDNQTDCFEAIKILFKIIEKLNHNPHICTYKKQLHIKCRTNDFNDVSLRDIQLFKLLEDELKTYNILTS